MDLGPGDSLAELKHSTVFPTPILNVTASRDAWGAMIPLASTFGEVLFPHNISSGEDPDALSPPLTSSDSLAGAPGLFPDFNLDFLSDSADGNHSFGGSSNSSFHFSAQDLATKKIIEGISQFFFVIICIVGLCGNSLVIYVVLRYNKMQTVTNLYILNLAVADECFLIGLPFLFVTSFMRHWPFGHVVCKIYMTTTGINQFTSSAFLTVMSGDRYIAICHAVRGTSYRTPLVARVVALTTWMVSAILMAPLFMYAQSRVTNNATGLPTCGVYPDEGDERNTEVIFSLYNFFASFLIPLVFIVLFYSQVITTLRKTRASRKKNTRKKVTRLVFTVIIAYVICWLPYWIGQMAFLVRHLDLVPLPISDIGLMNFNLVASIGMYSNSAINPILYAFLSDNFRKSFFKACTWCTFLQNAGDNGGRQDAEVTGAGKSIRPGLKGRLMRRRRRLRGGDDDFKMFGGASTTRGTTMVTSYGGGGRGTTTTVCNARADPLGAVADDGREDDEEEIITGGPRDDVLVEIDSPKVEPPGNVSGKGVKSTCRKAVIITEAIVSGTNPFVNPPGSEDQSDLEVEDDEMNFVIGVDEDDEEDLDLLCSVENKCVTYHAFGTAGRVGGKSNDIELKPTFMNANTTNGNDSQPQPTVATCSLVTSDL